MKHFLLLLSLSVLLTPSSVLAGRLDCKVSIPHHERHVTTATRKAAFVRARIPWEKRSCCRVDHIVPLELGGVNDLSNLQIQTVKEAHLKDLDENRLREEVCEGKVTLAEAQRQMRQWKPPRGAKEY